MSGVWNPTRPELDREPPLDGEPKATYVICSTPRSGSGLLCRGLVAAGAGGVPAEYLNPRQRQPLADRWGCGSSIEAYSRALRRRRTDDAGTFGIKVHWNQVAALCDERAAAGDPVEPAALLEELFPGAVYVHILRLDLTRQAISLWRAEHSGVWAERIGSKPAQRRPPRYRYRQIRTCRDEIAAQEAEWIRFFRTAAIDPVEVIYEDLDAAFGTETERVLRAIGVKVRSELVEPDGRRQSDAATGELAEQFLRDEARHRQPSAVWRAGRRIRRRLA
jgi:LPS sulfotransferase NodH